MSQTKDVSKPSVSLGQRWKKVTEIREFVIIVIILAITVLMTICSPYFMTGNNIIAVLLNLSLNSVIAVGMTLVLITGGVDLSVGSNLAFSGLITALCLKAGVPILISSLIGVAIGAAIGLINGLVVAKLKINAFITTLATMKIFRGLTVVITNGATVTRLPEGFSQIAQASLWGIQSLIPIALVIVIAGDIMLRRSRYFRQNYYIGGNERAAIFSGINVDGVRIASYTICGALTGLAGVLTTSRLGAASTTAGNGLEFTVMTAVIVGGASMAGGEGTIFGAFLGMLLMSLITNALTLFGVGVNWNQVVIGTVLLLTVLIDVMNQRRKQQQGLKRSAT